MSYRLLPIAFVLALALLFGSAPFSQSEAAPSTLPYRLFVPLAASDGVYTPPPVTGDLPPADPSYCAPNLANGAPPSPPDTIFGFLTIGGGNAPVGTLVQVAFDGKVGPAARVKEAGGYRLDYAAGGASCSNKVGAAIAILVNGVPFATGVNIGDPAANPFLRFDISAP